MAIALLLFLGGLVPVSLVWATTYRFRRNAERRPTQRSQVSTRQHLLGWFMLFVCTLFGGLIAYASTSAIDERLIDKSKDNQLARLLPAWGAETAIAISGGRKASRRN